MSDFHLGKLNIHLLVRSVELSSVLELYIVNVTSPCDGRFKLGKDNGVTFDIPILIIGQHTMGTMFMQYALNDILCNMVGWEPGGGGAFVYWKMVVYLNIATEHLLLISTQTELNKLAKVIFHSSKEIRNNCTLLVYWIISKVLKPVANEYME